MTSASLHKTGQSAPAGHVDVSMTMTVPTLGHCATKEDAPKDLAGQVDLLQNFWDLGLVDLLPVDLETYLDNIWKTIM